MNTLRCKLIAKEKDVYNYQTLVFENLESNPPFGHKYLMITRLPNWEHREVEVGELGYVSYKEVCAGKDTWYDSEKQVFIPYNYTNTYFIKFVQEKDNSKKDIIL